MKILGCQWNLAWEDREANFARAEKLLEGQEGDLIVLPEMFSSGFSMNLDVVCEPNPSPAEQFLRRIAAQKGALCLGGVARNGEGGKGKNEAVGFLPDGAEVVRYQKNRTFRYTSESDYFENGTELPLFAWKDWKVAPLICYDLRFPELFRRHAAQGAELFVVIASWPSVRADHWVTLLRARAIENLAYVIGVNRCGSDPNYPYPGRSLVVDPWGEIIADAGEEEGLLMADLELEKVRNWRSEFPALKDLEI